VARGVRGKDKKIGYQGRLREERTPQKKGVKKKEGGGERGNQPLGTQVGLPKKETRKSDYGKGENVSSMLWEERKKEV